MNDKKMQNIVVLIAVSSMMQITQGYANQTFSSFSFGFFMFSITAVMFFIRCIRKNTLRDMLAVFTVPKVAFKLVLIGTFCALANFLGSTGYKYGNPQTGTFLMNTSILMVGVGSVIVYHEKFSKRDIFCGFAMFFGVLLILGVDFSAMTFSFGDIFFILSALAVSTNAFRIATVMEQTKVKVDSYTVSFYNSFVGAIGFFILMVATGDVHQVLTGFENKYVFIAVMMSGVLQYWYFASYYLALSELPVWFVRAAQLVNPVIVMIAAIFIYDTIPTVSAVIGGAIILVSGYFLLQRQRKNT